MNFDKELLIAQLSALATTKRDRERQLEKQCTFRVTNEENRKQLENDLLFVFRQLLDQLVEEGKFQYGKTRLSDNSVLVLEGDRVKYREYHHRYKQDLDFSNRSMSFVLAKLVGEPFSSIVAKIREQDKNRYDTPKVDVNPVVKVLNVPTYIERYDGCYEPVTAENVTVDYRNRASYDTTENLKVKLNILQANGSHDEKDIKELIIINDDAIFSAATEGIKELREALETEQLVLDTEFAQLREPFDKAYGKYLNARDL